MHLKQHFPRAWMLGGVVFFALGSARGEVAVSTAPLTGPTTAAMNEPFINPFGTKMPKIVSGYGKRTIPPALLVGATVQMTTEMHDGVDYRAFPGSAVKAARSGKVIFAGFSKMYVNRTDKTDQSRFVIIRHPDGTSTRYVHLNTLHVKPGMDVQSGQVLGVLAESSEWTEPVLHFEIRDAQGRPMDPVKVMAEQAPVAVKVP